MNPKLIRPQPDGERRDSLPLRNLRRTVVLLSTLAVLFGAVFSWLSWRAEYARQSTQLAVIVEMGGQAMNTYLGELEKALQILGEDIRDAEGTINVKAADFQLKRFRKIHPDLRIAIVARADGQILSTSESRPGDSLPTLGAEPSFVRSREELQRGARLSIGRAFVGPVSGDWIIPIRYGIRSSDGAVLFMLGVGLPVSKTYRFWKDAPLPHGAALGLTRDDMYLVSRHPVPGGTELKDVFGHSQKGALAQHLQQQNFPRSGTVNGISSISSTATVFAFRRLADYPVTFFVNMPKSNIWVAWWQDVRVPYLLIALWLVTGLLLYRWVQKQQQASDTAQETRLRLAISAAQVGLWMRDLQTNTVQWSAELKRLLGYEPHELQESHEEWLQRVHPDDLEPAMTRFRRVRDGEVDHYNAEMRLRHRDGSYRTFLSRAVALREDGRITKQLLGAIVDITERKRAEETLRQSEQSLAITLQSIGDAVIATDETGLITRMNRTAERLTGWPLAEAAGRPLSEVFRIINAQTRTPSINPVQLVMARGEVVGLANHTALIARDGCEYQIADSAAPIRDAANRIVGVVLVFSDVTAKYQAEATRTQLAAIVENSNDAIFSRALDGTILSWNAGAEKMLGYTAAEAIGQSVTFALPPGRTPHLARNNAALLRGDVIARETTRTTKDGRLIHVWSSLSPIIDTAGNICGASVILHDVTTHKQAETERNQLAAIIQNSNDAIYSRTLDGAILSWNAGAERMLGYSAEEAIGKPTSFIRSPHRAPDRTENNEAVLRGEVVSRESDRLTKDGQIINVLSSHSPIRDDAGNVVGVSLILQDITKLKQAEAMRTQLAAIVEHSHDAIYSRALDGTILSWNAGAERMFGYTAAEAIGRSITITLPPGRPPHLPQNNQALLRGDVVALESDRLTKDRGIIHVWTTVSPIRDGTGNIVGASVIMRDITALKRAEDTQARLATIVENAHDAIISRTLDGTVTSWNAAAEALFGYSATEAIGGPMTIIMPAGGEADIAKHSQQLLGGATILATETVRRTKDGRMIQVERSISPVKNAAHEIIGAAIIMRDISELKQSEAARASLEAQLLESQKMQAIGTLAGGIAHDFNNIIAAILGNVELARRDAENSPPVLESLTEIHKASTRARDLVQQILAFSRRQPTERKPIALETIVLESVRLLRVTLPARLTLQVHCSPDVPAVLADATQIQQAVLNLATNAMQAMSSGAGRIDIALDTVVLDAALAKALPALRTLFSAHPGRTVRIKVGDTGPGMDSATLERIFEPFFTTKPAGEGTGLGLSVVHGIVERHDGVIVVESQPGKGTTFTIYLPVAVMPTNGPESEEAIATPVPMMRHGGSRHVLYLDDDESLVFLVTRLLERNGFRVSGYTEQRNALDALRADPFAVDLVVTDYNMPGMSGLDIVREVHNMRADLPVAVASGFIDEVLHAKATAAGVRELIFKADNVETFCAAVERLLQTVHKKPKRS